MMRWTCQHTRTVCLHGDHVWARMKVFTFCWWKRPVIHRQACVDCGKALDRSVICTRTGRCWHIGPWMETVR